MRTLFRWGGATLFGVSLLSFGMLYGIRLRRPLPAGSSALPDALNNIVLFSIFALHHSVMARSGAKAWLTRIVPPDLERTVYVWTASPFLAVCLLWQPLPGVVWETRGAGIALYLVQLSGVALVAAAARIAGTRELLGLQQPDRVTPVAFRADGPYGLVRHPIYLGWVLIVFATPAMTMSKFLFAAVSTLYVIAAIPLEERTLAMQHDERYLAYQRKVRWRLLPLIW